MSATGGSSHGGGGGGGRIAIYHSGDNHWTGKYLTPGGYGSAGHAGSGTVFIEDLRDGGSHKRLIVDNAGYTESKRIDEVEKLTLSGPSVPWNSQTFYSYGGVQVTTTGVPYEGHHIRYPFYEVRSGSATSGHHYRTAAAQAVITVTFPHDTYVDHMRVYPHCDE